MRALARPLALAGCVLSLIVASCAIAQESGGLAPIQDAAVTKECGACHMAYPAQMLPMRSWKALLGNLGDHFGENASLPAPELASIEAYLIAHAGDAPDSTAGRRFMRGIPAGATPLRITDERFWKRAHSEIDPTIFASAKVKSKANCLACHQGAAAGQYGEEE